jgi:predicted small lipoprotein YifL
MRTLLVLLAMIALLAGCGIRGVTGPKPPDEAAAIQERQKPEQVPPDKDYYRWFGEDDPIHPGYTPP